jgi:dicarboxylate transporter 10
MRVRDVLLECADRLNQVVLVRMCADAAKPSAERFRYSDAITALCRITREEGLRVFGRGLSANVVRSVLMSKKPQSETQQERELINAVDRHLADCAVSGHRLLACAKWPGLELTCCYSYSAAKRILLSRTQLRDDIRTHALASLFAGTVATTACAPADVLKSRIQNASKGSSVCDPSKWSIFPANLVLGPSCRCCTSSVMD